MLPSFPEALKETSLLIHNDVANRILAVTDLHEFNNAKNQMLYASSTHEALIDSLTSRETRDRFYAEAIRGMALQAEIMAQLVSACIPRSSVRSALESALAAQWQIFEAATEDADIEATSKVLSATFNNVIKESNV